MMLSVRWLGSDGYGGWIGGGWNTRFHKALCSVQSLFIGLALAVGDGYSGRRDANLYPCRDSDLGKMDTICDGSHLENLGDLM